MFTFFNIYFFKLLINYLILNKICRKNKFELNPAKLHFLHDFPQFEPDRHSKILLFFPT